MAIKVNSQAEVSTSFERSQAVERQVASADLLRRASVRLGA
jgi:hypothetical protein